jgi:nucleoside-diphosphate-sugar epimerase
LYRTFTDDLSIGSVVKIDLPDTRTEDEANTEFFAVDVANDYDGLKDAFKGADAVFHFAGIPCPLWDPPATVRRGLDRRYWPLHAEMCDHPTATGLRG